MSVLHIRNDCLVSHSTGHSSFTSSNHNDHIIADIATTPKIDLSQFPNTEKLISTDCSPYSLDNFAAIQSRLKSLHLIRCSLRRVSSIIELSAVQQQDRQQENAEEKRNYESRSESTDLEELPHWLNLQSLVLKFSHLTQLDNSLSFLSNLTKLDVSWNRLESFEQILLLPNLKWANLSYNQIRTIPKSARMTELKLENLFLHQNFLSSLSGIENLRRLKNVNLSNNLITRFSDLSELVNLGRLRRLNLYGNPIFHSKKYRNNVLRNISHTVDINFKLDEKSLSNSENHKLRPIKIVNIFTTSNNSKNGGVVRRVSSRERSGRGRRWWWRPRGGKEEDATHHVNHHATANVYEEWQGPPDNRVRVPPHPLFAGEDQEISVFFRAQMAANRSHHCNDADPKDDHTNHEDVDDANDCVERDKTASSEFESQHQHNHPDNHHQRLRENLRRQRELLSAVKKRKSVLSASRRNMQDYETDAESREIGEDCDPADLSQSLSRCSSASHCTDATATTNRGETIRRDEGEVEQRKIPTTTRSRRRSRKNSKRGGSAAGRRKFAEMANANKKIIRHLQQEYKENWIIHFPPGEAAERGVGEEEGAPEEAAGAAERRGKRGELEVRESDSKLQWTNEQWQNCIRLAAYQHVIFAPNSSHVNASVANSSKPIIAIDSTALPLTSKTHATTTTTPTTTTTTALATEAAAARKLTQQLSPECFASFENLQSERGNGQAILVCIRWRRHCTTSSTTSSSTSTTCSAANMAGDCVTALQLQPKTQPNCHNRVSNSSSVSSASSSVNVAQNVAVPPPPPPYLPQYEQKVEYYRINLTNELECFSTNSPSKSASNDIIMSDDRNGDAILLEIQTRAKHSNQRYFFTFSARDSLEEFLERLCYIPHTFSWSKLRIGYSIPLFAYNCVICGNDALYCLSSQFRPEKCVKCGGSELRYDVRDDDDTFLLQSYRDSKASYFEMAAPPSTLSGGSLTAALSQSLPVAPQQKNGRTDVSFSATSQQFGSIYDRKQDNTGNRDAVRDFIDEEAEDRYSTERDFVEDNSKIDTTNNNIEECNHQRVDQTDDEYENRDYESDDVEKRGFTKSSKTIINDPEGALLIDRFQDYTFSDSYNILCRDDEAVHSATMFARDPKRKPHALENPLNHDNSNLETGMAQEKPATRTSAGGEEDRNTTTAICWMEEAPLSKVRFFENDFEKIDENLKISFSVNYLKRRDERILYMLKCHGICAKTFSTPLECILLVSNFHMYFIEWTDRANFEFSKCLRLIKCVPLNSVTGLHCGLSYLWFIVFHNKKRSAPFILLTGDRRRTVKFTKLILELNSVQNLKKFQLQFQKYLEMPANQNLRELLTEHQLLPLCSPIANTTCTAANEDKEDDQSKFGTPESPSNTMTTFAQMVSAQKQRSHAYSFHMAVNVVFNQTEFCSLLSTTLTNSKSLLDKSLGKLSSLLQQRSKLTEPPLVNNLPHANLNANLNSCWNLLYLSAEHFAVIKLIGSSSGGGAQNGGEKKGGNAQQPQQQRFRYAMHHRTDFSSIAKTVVLSARSCQLVSFEDSRQPHLGVQFASRAALIDFLADFRAKWEAVFSTQLMVEYSPMTSM